MSVMYKSLSLQQCVDLIASIGDLRTVLVSGEMGIGKSSILKSLAKLPQFKDYIFCYVDLTTKDVGDFTVPKIRTLDGVEVCSFIPNEEFGLHFKGKKVVMMMDELGKAKGGVLNACLRLMLERQLGMYTLDGIIFATTNLSVEGLGDNVPAHVRNRVIQVRVSKPDYMTMMEYAIHNAWHPVIIGSMREFPEMLASFEDYEKPEMNVLINDPRTVRLACVTPRSLHAASDLITRTAILGDAILWHAMTGTVGEAAMHKILTIYKLDAQLVSWEELVKNPTTVTVPSNGAAACMLVSKAIQRIEKATMDAFMDFLPRLSKEAQGLFARSVLSEACPKQNVAATNLKFQMWAAANNYMFGKTAKK